MYFKNRQDAGRKLASALTKWCNGKTAILALPRGGVPVAYEIAKILDLPLDTIIVRKLGIAFNPEFAFGAISEAGVIIKDDVIIGASLMSHEEVWGIIKKEKEELERRKTEYGSGNFLRWGDYDRIILVDDGLATGSTMEAAIAAVKILYHPDEIIVAVPVAASDSATRIRPEVFRLIALYEIEHFGAVGRYYEEFPQTTDEEVIFLLQNQ